MAELTTPEGMAALGVSRTAYQDLLRSGRLPGRKVGGKWLVEVSAIEAELERRAAERREREDKSCRGNPSETAYCRGCRCDGCRREHAKYCAHYRGLRRERVEAGTAVFEHGEFGYSNWGCRCDVCKAAWRAHLDDDRMVRREKTLPFAERHRQEFTDADFAIMADESLSVMEKALAMGRTYDATSSALVRFRAGLMEVSA